MAQSKHGKEFLDSILDEQEQTYIQHFVENEKMFESVRKAITAGLYEQGVIKKGKKLDIVSNIAFGTLFEGDNPNNEKLGEKVRALWQGLNYLEFSLEQLRKYAKHKDVETTEKNPAV